MTVLPIMLPGAKRTYQQFLEKDLPEISLKDLPNGLGMEPVEFTVEVEDQGSGIDEVIVRAEQGQDVRTLYKKKYDSRQRKDKLTVQLDGRTQGFREGRLRISVLVFDRSFWNTSMKKSVDLTVDFVAPQISILSTQNYVRKGGVELLFYRLNSEEEAFSGISIRSAIFPGFPAKNLDRDFEVETDIYFSFFTVPLDFDEQQESITLIARDGVGNSSSARVPTRVQNLRTGRRDVLFNANELTRITDLLFEEYIQFETDRGAVLDKNISERDTLLSRFTTVNSGFVNALEESLKQLMSRPKSKQYWTEVFGRPGGSRLPGSFGDLLTIRTRDLTLGEQRADGVYFTGGREGEIRAVNDGIVIFNDTLGVYGKTIIVDHGFGLCSMFTHLASAVKYEGDRVSKGEVLGEVGQTGLLARKAVGLQFRLLGHPVRPEEWWDKNWIKENITKKTELLKRQLGLRTRKRVPTR